MIDSSKAIASSNRPPWQILPANSIACCTFTCVIGGCTNRASDYKSQSNCTTGFQPVIRAHYSTGWKPVVRSLLHLSQRKRLAEALNQFLSQLCVPRLAKLWIAIQDRQRILPRD